MIWLDGGLGGAIFVVCFFSWYGMRGIYFDGDYLGYHCEDLCEWGGYCCLGLDSG